MARFIIEGLKKRLEELQEEWKYNEKTKLFLDDLVVLSNRLIEKAEEDDVIENCELYSPGDCDNEAALLFFAKQMDGKCATQYYKKDSRVCAVLIAYGWFHTR